MSKLIRGLITFVSLSSLVFAISCAGDAPGNTNPVQQDSGNPWEDSGSHYYDSQPQQLDSATPKVDQYVWPDTTGSVDTWSWPTDTYTGTPFGCKNDADCFGKRCCPTPWGVKVCADVCTAAP